MKRLVLFGIVIFLVIIGGFLVVDKVWLHKVFKLAIATPGSCLILEEKYCKMVKIDEKDGQKAVVANLPDGVSLFSPIDSTSSSDLFVHDEDDLNQNNWDFGIEISNDSNVLYDFIYSKKDNLKNKSVLKKGEQIGIVSSKKLNKFDEYNFVFTISQNSDDNFEKSNEMLLKIFNK